MKMISVGLALVIASTTMIASMATAQMEVSLLSPWDGKKNLAKTTLR